MKLKVCGMRDQGNLNDLAKVAPDYVGFIFFRKSKRFVSAMPSIEELPRKTKTVGVFVDAPQAELYHIVAQNELDMVQLHGRETPDYCDGVRNQVPVIKAFNVGSDFDWGLLDPYAAHVDYFLFDATGKLPGGNGVRFDWSILENYQLEVPFFLSGGITLEHAEEIKQLKNLPIHAVDVNSGFELEPALKNVDALSAFEKIIRS